MLTRSLLTKFEDSSGEIWTNGLRKVSGKAYSRSPTLTHTCTYTHFKARKKLFRTIPKCTLLCLKQGPPTKYSSILILAVSLSPKVTASSGGWTTHTPWESLTSTPGAQAIKIPRSRFAPVKKCDDLLALRSDAYKLTEAGTTEVNESMGSLGSFCPVALCFTSPFSNFSWQWNYMKLYGTCELR